MKVKYIGPKGRMPITLPVGAGKSSIKETRWAEPIVELDDKDALKLVQLDPSNFELVVEERVMEKEAVADSKAADAEVKAELEEKKKIVDGIKEKQAEAVSEGEKELSPEDEAASDWDEPADAEEPIDPLDKVDPVHSDALEKEDEKHVHKKRGRKPHRLKDGE